MIASYSKAKADLVEYFSTHNIRRTIKALSISDRYLLQKIFVPGSKGCQDEARIQDLARRVIHYRQGAGSSLLSRFFRVHFGSLLPSEQLSWEVMRAVTLVKLEQIEAVLKEETPLKSPSSENEIEATLEALEKCFDKYRRLNRLVNVLSNKPKMLLSDDQRQRLESALASGVLFLEEHCYDDDKIDELKDYQALGSSMNVIQKDCLLSKVLKRDPCCYLTIRDSILLRVNVNPHQVQGQICAILRQLNEYESLHGLPTLSEEDKRKIIQFIEGNRHLYEMKEGYVHRGAMLPRTVEFDCGKIYIHLNTKEDNAKPPHGADMKMTRSIPYHDLESGPLARRTPLKSGKVAHLRNEHRIYERLGNIPGVVPCLHYRQDFPSHKQEKKDEMIVPFYRRGTLWELIKKKEPYNQILYARNLFQALQRIHARGVVHCDLHASNVLISDEGRPLVHDFGRAHFRGEKTPNGITAEPSIDVYSLGVLLSQVFSPFPASDHPRLHGLFHRMQQFPNNPTLQAASDEFDKIAPLMM